MEFTVILQLGTEHDETESYGFQTSSKKYNYNLVKSIPHEDTSYLRVLLLENDYEVINYYQNLIDQLPYSTKIEIAKDLKSAEELIAKFRFDLYLLSSYVGGSEFYYKNLGFLSIEIIIYSSSEIQIQADGDCQVFDGLVDASQLIQICKTLYPKRMRILFVDDTKLFRIAWRMFHGDHNIICAASPEEALQLLSDTSTEFGAYVLDYHYSNSSLNGELLAHKILEAKNDAHVLIASGIDQQLETFKCISKKDYEIRKLVNATK